MQRKLRLLFFNLWDSQIVRSLAFLSAPTFPVRLIKKLNSPRRSRIQAAIFGVRLAFLSVILYPPPINRGADRSQSLNISLIPKACALDQRTVKRSELILTQLLHFYYQKPNHLSKSLLRIKIPVSKIYHSSSSRLFFVYSIKAFVLLHNLIWYTRF